MSLWTWKVNESSSILSANYSSHTLNTPGSYHVFWWRIEKDLLLSSPKLTKHAWGWLDTVFLSYEEAEDSWASGFDPHAQQSTEKVTAVSPDCVHCNNYRITPSGWYHCSCFPICSLTMGHYTMNNLSANRVLFFKVLHYLTFWIPAPSLPLQVNMFNASLM